VNKLVYFNTYPTELIINVGDYYIEFRIGIKTNTSTGIYSVYFNLINGDAYNVPPVLKVNVI
jgi:hypothetical protein